MLGFRMMLWICRRFMIAKAIVYNSIRVYADQNYICKGLCTLGNLHFLATSSCGNENNQLCSSNARIDVSTCHGITLCAKTHHVGVPAPKSLGPRLERRKHSLTRFLYPCSIPVYCRVKYTSLSWAIIFSNLAVFTSKFMERSHVIKPN